LVVLVLVILPGVAVVFITAAGLPGVVVEEEVLLFGAILFINLFRYPLAG
jgi:hypothetical protein